LATRAAWYFGRAKVRLQPSRAAWAALSG